MGGSEEQAEPDARVSVEKQQIKQDLEDEVYPSTHHPYMYN